MEKVKRVLPIKDTKLLKAVEANLLHGFRAGRRNYTIFQVGKVTLLPVTLVLRTVCQIPPSVCRSIA